MGKRKLRGITEEEWQKKWEEFWADMRDIPKPLWEFIPENLTAGGDPDDDMDEIIERFAGEPTMLPDDALSMLDHHQRLILANLLLLKYIHKVKPDPALAIIMTLLGDVISEQSGVLHREFKGKPEEAKLEYLM